MQLWGTPRLATGDWYGFLINAPKKQTFLLKRQEVKEVMSTMENSDRARATGEEGIQWDAREGAGIVSEPLTFDLILQSFYTIWLKARPEEHMARVRGQGDLRPMADDRSAMAELRTILLSREPLYARASAVVDTSGLSVDAAAARLVDAVAPVLQSEARMFARG